MKVVIDGVQYAPIVTLSKGNEFYDNLLNTTFESDVGCGTLRSYFYALLKTLWFEKEEFSGKRPFGNSGWEYDVYKVLIQTDVVEGELDEDGYIMKVDEASAEEVVAELIDYIFNS